MKVLGIVLASLVGLLVVVGGIYGITYMNVANTCVEKESGLKASKELSKSTYDNFWKGVKEAAQVPAEYQKGMAETYKTIMDARYQNSTKVMMNWIKEANPNFDPSMYVKIQQLIEAGRNNFLNSQKQMVDKVRDYQSYVGQMPNSYFARQAGYPKINWDDYKVVSSDKTDNAFETHKDNEPTDVFGKK